MEMFAWLESSFFLNGVAFLRSGQVPSYSFSVVQRIWHFSFKIFTQANGFFKLHTMRKSFLILFFETRSFIFFSTRRNFFGNIFRTDFNTFRWRLNQLNERQKRNLFFIYEQQTPFYDDKLVLISANQMFSRSADWKPLKFRRKANRAY